MSKEEHEGLDNTNSIARIIDSGDENEIRMILGDRERIRHAGIVRPGIKIPKSTCSKAEKIKYEELYAQGIPFDEIDRQMSGEPKSSKSKLRPLNVDYFTVRECDFRSPADARFIMDNYADDDGKLRRIPCWFSLSELHLVIPHGFRAFGGGGVVRACSYYEGDNLMCRFVSKDVQNPKKDDWQTRPCDSDNCEAYAKKRCKFGGLIKSHIPGLKGMGEIIVATTSWYGLADAVANLKRIAGVLGRFNGLFNNEPFLELCKVQERVKTPDGKHVNQYIVTIEPSVDLMELAQHCDP
ncbi:hypothetical protein KAR91_75880, partial [Candidatus Pacearchaeota archaeon]|nr:hypothetical protein [Candidatus Pacearchaeota archaeon]